MAPHSWQGRSSFEALTLPRLPSQKTAASDGGFLYSNLPAWTPYRVQPPGWIHMRMGAYGADDNAPLGETFKVLRFAMSTYTLSPASSLVVYFRSGCDARF